MAVDLPSKILDYVLKEGNTMIHAPVLSIALIALGCYIGWVAYRMMHKERLQLASERLDYAGRQLEQAGESKLLDDASRKRKIEMLAALIDEGRDVRFSTPRLGLPSYSEEARRAWMKEWNAWTFKVTAELKEKMAPQAVTKFQHDTGLPSPADKPFAYPYPLLERHIQNLMDIMENIDRYL